MPQAKKNTSVKTAKRGGSRGTKAAVSKKACAKKSCAKSCHYSNSERNHIYIVTAMGMIAGLLLCANIAMLVI